MGVDETFGRDDFSQCTAYIISYASAIVKRRYICYADEMTKECEDRIDLSEYDLTKVSMEQLEALLSLLSSCKSCHGCDADREQLERIIEEQARQ